MSTEVLDHEEIQAFTIRKELVIDAPIDIAFECVLEELGPVGQGHNGTSLQMKIEAWPGGRWYRDLGDGVGHLWGHVQVIKPPTLLELIGPMPMSYPAVNHVQYRLKADGQKTHLSFVHRAMGLITPEHRDGMSQGWGEKLELVLELARRKMQGK
jgi:hypothetical protein